MRACIRGLEPGGLYPSVDLRRGDAAVAQHILDGAEDRATVEEVRGERVTECERVCPTLQRRTLGPHAKTPPHVARRQPPAGFREEQGRLGPISVQRGS